MSSTLSLEVRRSDKFNIESFLHISVMQRLEVGRLYRFLEYPEKIFIRQALCIDSQEIPLRDLSSRVTFLSSNCDHKIFQKIQQDRNVSLDSLVSVGVFTNSSNSKLHYYAEILN